MKNLLEVENTKNEMKKHKLLLFVKGTWLGDVDYDYEDEYFINKNDFISDTWEINILTDVKTNEYDFGTVMEGKNYDEQICLNTHNLSKNQIKNSEKILISSFSKTEVENGGYGSKWVKEWYQCDIYTDRDFDSKKLKLDFLQVGRNKNNLSIQPYHIFYDEKNIDLEFVYGDDKGQDIIESWNELKSYLN